MTKNTLLVEIGTEEIPAKILNTISLSFYNNFNEQLKLYNISYTSIKYFSTPRRLALKVIDIDTSDKTIQINKKGPLIIDSYDKHGLPTEAANSWAKYCRINLDQAQRLKTKKGEWLCYNTIIKQEKTELLLPKITEIALKKIIIIKPMRWESQKQKFSRPIRNVVILLNNKIIKGKVFNIDSNNFLHHHISSKEKNLRIKNANEYPNILWYKNNIIADYTIRKEEIIKQINILAQKKDGFIKNNNALIEEVTALVESPVAFLAHFEKKFLNIPKKILVHVIEYQQKCFPIYDIKNVLLPYFIFISNINSKKPNEIIIGNEKVMHARLSDAEFFLQNDRKMKLEDYRLSLKKVLFHKNLGSLYEKTLRLQLLIEWIVQHSIGDIKIKTSIRAAYLSKCDLVTNMVCEFPELQGIVGMYYAAQDQEKKDISIALKEQYLPSFSGDKLPSTIIGCALSIADKIDTISGMFYLGKIPNSEKDPFALRRLAIGILRIIIIKNIPLDLKNLIKKSLDLYNKKHVDHLFLCKKIIKFFMTRLIYWYEKTGYDIQIIKSVLSCKSTQLIDIDKKIKAISFFKTLDCSKSIILSVKRISNILKQEDRKITGKINIKLIKKTEEIELFTHIDTFNNNTKRLFEEKKYKEILLKIKELDKPIDNFFRNIKIYDDDLEIRNNRFVLLKKLEKIFTKIINFSYLY
ncbi:glycine--tRNA ligase subunit beta [Buchnera aphidicola (Brachycaudus cardui)]|uniref:Glycine--tRNA ligase beta subunit n=1 Tax=Buchnera aphidicola (Brachycaudus cardui) TaxID=557993 RepID=A0A4D6XWU2_9GAMM|nr:glycine--tRNA ligase subunit beta [Buchnera aphidicola]QCI20287.1 glycine--tRNA ligase subunit beta [Buchnera aphidicola (Brachycaudus cardui)]